MVDVQLTRDTTSADISPVFVHSGKTGVKPAGKEASEFGVMGSPLEFTLNELLNVFDQLGRGDLNMTERVELARRARGYIDQLKGAGNGQVVSELIEEGDNWMMQADIPASTRKDLASNSHGQSTRVSAD